MSYQRTTAKSQTQAQETSLICGEDRDILRRLVSEYAEVAAAPVHREKTAMWRALNRLQPDRPMVWINEICWHEFAGDELATHCTGRFAAAVENEIRRNLYKWRHMPADMVLDSCVYSPMVFHDSGFGIDVEADFSEMQFGADHYKSVIRTEADIARIQDPVITPDWDETERRYQALQDAVGDIMPVEKRGVRGAPRAAWDILVQWYGVEEMMYDMIDCPELVHRAMERTVDALLARHQQFEDMGLLSLNNTNTRVGTGGLGCTDELPAPDFDGHVRMKDMWGNQMSQIFSEVSPQMHDEFALEH